jgi:cellulose synthase/poly-beta-1,6-N-acetylglucosamine synthase-like glycosyltransferase
MTSARPEAEKSPFIVLLTLTSWLAVSVVSWTFFWPTVPNKYGYLTFACLQSLYLGWMLFWLWGIHNFWHQIAVLFFRRPAPQLSPISHNASVAILYMTCDDFDAQACESCMNQTYPNVRLIICDDSSDAFNGRVVEAWAQKQSVPVTVSRRVARKGFKAGNMNYAISRHVTEEYLLVCDADEVLPPDFVCRMLGRFADEGVGFVQASHRARITGQGFFARMFGPTIDIFYRYCLPSRNQFGFVSSFGHGVMLRRNVWLAVGGFPEIVSEDIAFATRARLAGFRGVFAEDIVAHEAFPPTFRAFAAQSRKVIEGTIEYFRIWAVPIIRSPRITFTEKADLFLTFTICWLPLVMILNLCGGLLLSYLCALDGQRELAMWLLAIFLVGPLTPLLPLIACFFKEPGKYVPFALSAPIAYVSMMPLLAFRVLIHTLHLGHPQFRATGQIGRQHQSAWQYSWMIFWGSGIMIAAAILPSPASPASICAGVMILLGPLMCLTDRNGPAGILARYCGFLPYVVLITLLAANGTVAHRKPNTARPLHPCRAPLTEAKLTYAK